MILYFIQDNRKVENIQLAFCLHVSLLLQITRLMIVLLLINISMNVVIPVRSCRSFNCVIYYESMTTTTSLIVIACCIVISLGTISMALITDYKDKKPEKKK
uniref:Uncharacterized protein n=1 Tax=uncultured marine bacterium 314 TaxID=257387 RepID=Q6SHJ2_9BACT|nr:hypothetical protein MBMO_EBAC750-09G06.0 [uncultured marine bacterium 314]